MILAHPYPALLVLTVLLGSRLSLAATVDAQGDCPRAADVTAALDPLLSARSASSAAASVTVEDLGTSWQVQVAEHSAKYSDAARDCAERARVAAVFAALVLEPPDIGVPAPVPAPTPKPTPPPESQRVHRLELSPEFVVAPGSGARRTALSWGGDLRWLFSGNRLGLAVGLGTVAPTTVKVNQFQASLTRVALDASARLSWRAGPVGFGTELGPYGALLLAQGRGLFENRSSTHFDAGARFALRIQTYGRWVSPFLAAKAELSARKFPLAVNPSGNVGTAPRIWLALMLGVAI